ncbi:MAG: hypothetical protein IH987_19605, partial [Planctomycetes bacterium]|nr:hypothetical protein [Planctomycetota bacterium]
MMDDSSVKPLSVLILGDVDCGEDLARWMGAHASVEHVESIDEAFEALSGLQADSSVKVVVERNTKQRTLSAKLSTLPEEILSRDHLPSADRGPQENDDQPA